MTKSHVFMDESVIDTELYLGVDSNFLRVKHQEKTKIIQLTLTADLESQGQTDVCSTFLIFSCMQYTYWIMVSIFAYKP